MIASKQKPKRRKGATPREPAYPCATCPGDSPCIECEVMVSQTSQRKRGAQRGPGEDVAAYESARERELEKLGLLPPRPAGLKSPDAVLNVAGEPNPQSPIPNPSSLIPHPSSFPPDASKPAVLIALAAIHRSPFNPREDFPPGEIAELAETMRVHGLLEAIVVRPLNPAIPKSPNPQYELVAGERRYRAAVELGWPQIAATVRVLSDRQAREICILENFQRRDLNPIEEARGFAMLLEGEGAPTQVELAARLGCTQGHVSNRLRLLELPEGIRKRIISGEITPTSARVLLQYREHPRLLEALDKELPNGKPAKSQRGKGTKAQRGKDGQADEPAPGPKAIAEQDLMDDLSNAAARLGKRLDRHGRWDSKLSENLPPFKPSPEERADLEIVAVTDGDWTDEYALNKRLFEQLEKEHFARARAKIEAKGKGKPAKAAKAEPKKKLSPAEQKRLAAEQAARKRELEEQFQKRLYRWRIDWQRYLIARTVRDDLSMYDLLRLLLLATEWRANRWSQEGRRSGADDALKDALGHKRGSAWLDLVNLENTAVEETACEVLARCFWRVDGDDEGATNTVEEADVERIAAHLEIDLAAEWLNDQAGPLSESYWDLHTKEQLIALAAELKVDKTRGDFPAMSKKDMVVTFLARRPGPESKDAGPPLPKEIVKAKPPKSRY